MKLSVPVLAGLIALLGWSGPRHAQAAMASQVFKDWRYECLAQTASGATEAPNAPGQVCLIQHDVRDGSSLQLAARVRLIGPQRRAVLLLIMPPTLTVNAPVGFSIDQGVVATMNVRQCNTQLCWAAVSIAEYFLASLKAGRQLAVIMKPGGVESRRVVLLDGFTSAFAVLQNAVH